MAKSEFWKAVVAIKKKMSVRLGLRRERHLGVDERLTKTDSDTGKNLVPHDAGG